MNSTETFPHRPRYGDVELDESRARSRPLGRILVLLLLASAVTGLAACSALGVSSGENPLDEEAGNQTVQVTIQNRNYKDATVWAHWNGSRIRVGQITGSTSETFEIRYRSDDVRFEVDFLAGDGYMGESIPVSPGDHLELTIRPSG